MCPKFNLSRSVERLKQDAKTLKKIERISQTEALNRVANSQGYPTWQTLLKDQVSLQPAPEFLQELNVVPYRLLLPQIDPSLREYLRAGDPTEFTALELLLKLRRIAVRPLRAATVGDTAIGRAIETALGIPQNPSRNPDYNGIEIKSARNRRIPNRSTIFAQVADWSQSNLQSSAAILDAYGYHRGPVFKLYCTLSTQTTNSQGLKFEIVGDGDILASVHVDNGEVARWSGDLLRSRLLQKHRETFWIKANVLMIDGVEHFNLVSVIHTHNPSLDQLMPLIKQGSITMDHLIKRQNGRVSEKGPLFKIKPEFLGDLFSEPVEYQLSP